LWCSTLLICWFEIDIESPDAGVAISRLFGINELRWAPKKRMKNYMLRKKLMLHLSRQQYNGVQNSSKQVRNFMHKNCLQNSDYIPVLCNHVASSFMVVVMKATQKNESVLKFTIGLIAHP